MICPRAAQQGIYLVLWFGNNETIAGKKNPRLRLPSSFESLSSGRSLASCGEQSMLSCSIFRDEVAVLGESLIPCLRALARAPASSDFWEKR